MRYPNLAFLVLCIILITFPINLHGACSFKLSNLPIPKDSLIVGDPREEIVCHLTDFTDTRPPTLTDPTHGLRMWTREEDSVMRSTQDVVQKFAEEAILENNNFMFQTYNLMIEKQSLFVRLFERSIMVNY